MVLCSVFTAVLVAALAHPASRLAKVMGWTPLRWLGERSYGIYLWCFPVIVLTTPVVDIGEANVERMIFQIALIIVLAALSWRFIEDPIRHGALQRLWATLRTKAVLPEWTQHERGRIIKSIWVATIVAGLALSVFLVGMIVNRPNASASSAIALTSSSDTASSAGATPIPGPALATEGVVSSGSGILQTDTAGKGPNATSGKGVTVIGDSVAIDLAPYLTNMLPGIIIDGKVGRQLIYTEPTVEQLRSEGKLGDRVIIELGTNGPFTSDQLNALLDSLGPVQQIVLANTREPRPWQNVVNAILAQVAASRPNVTLIDWYDASKGHGSFFYPDGVHLEPAGCWYYAKLITKAVQPEKAGLEDGKALLN
jgi:hypothetical protein